MTGSQTTAFFDVLKDGFQTIFIPKTGTYRFEVIAPGWNWDCSGARISGSVMLQIGKCQLSTVTKLYYVPNHFINLVRL